MVVAAVAVSLSAGAFADQIQSVRSEPIQPSQPAVVEYPQRIKLGEMAKGRR